MATLLLVASRNGSAGDAIADFFRKPLAAQEKEFSRYDFDDQFRIYISLDSAESRPTCIWQILSQEKEVLSQNRCG
jgi:hypothetical protein